MQHCPALAMCFSPQSGGKSPHSKLSVATVLWSAGACFRFLVPDAFCRSNIP